MPTPMTTPHRDPIGPGANNEPVSKSVLSPSAVSPIEWAPGAGPMNGRLEDDDMEFLMTRCDAYMAGVVAVQEPRFWTVLADREPLLRRVLTTRFGSQYPSVPEGELLPPNEIRMAASYLLAN